jgi:L-lactate dehydrogenase complex protein LldG
MALAQVFVSGDVLYLLPAEKGKTQVACIFSLPNKLLYYNILYIFYFFMSFGIAGNSIEKENLILYMSSREKILAAVLENQPSKSPLPDISAFKGVEEGRVEKYMETFINIGGSVFKVASINDIQKLIQENFDTNKRIITTLPELADGIELLSPTIDPHTFQDVELAVIKAHLAVAENGAVWLTEQVMGQRIIPYICQHLAVVVESQHIVPTLHEAYERIGEGQYGFGAFIGGPSKTADIEQALVLGAHGPISMTVFIMSTEMTNTSY